MQGGMDMNGITVSELYELCRELVDGGYGDKTVVISSDDEGNEYHTLYSGFLTDNDMLGKMERYGMLHDYNNHDDIVALG
jgi:hypothetical protein